MIRQLAMASIATAAFISCSAWSEELPATEGGGTASPGAAETVSGAADSAQKVVKPLKGIARGVETGANLEKAATDIGNVGAAQLGEEAADATKAADIAKGAKVVRKGLGWVSDGLTLAKSGADIAKGDYADAAEQLGTLTAEKTIPICKIPFVCKTIIKTGQVGTGALMDLHFTIVDNQLMRDAEAAQAYQTREQIRISRDLQKLNLPKITLGQPDPDPSTITGTRNTNKGPPTNNPGSGIKIDCALLRNCGTTPNSTPKNVVNPVKPNTTNPVGNKNANAVGNNVHVPASNNVSNAVSAHAAAAVGNHVSNAVGNKVSNVVGNKTANAVGNNVSNSVSNHVSATVGTKVGNSVSSTVSNRVSSTVSSRVTGVVGNRVSSTVSNSVAKSVGNRVPSDVRLKGDIVKIGILDNGLNLYRYRYLGGDRTLYVGVMAQEVERILPEAVSRSASGYLAVDYDRVGIKFQTWRTWRAEHVAAKAAHL